MLNLNRDLDDFPLTLRQKVETLVTRRVGKVELEAKDELTLYDFKKFTRLLEDINEEVDGLVSLFPGAHEAQRILCEEEVKEMNKDEKILALLKDAVDGQDKVLSDAISRATQSTSKPNINISFSGPNSGFQIGYQAGGISKCMALWAKRINCGRSP